MSVIEVETPSGEVIEVEIAGDQPTPQESAAISKMFAQQQQQAAPVQAPTPQDVPQAPVEQTQEPAIDVPDTSTLRGKAQMVGHVFDALSTFNEGGLAPLGALGRSLESAAKLQAAFYGDDPEFEQTVLGTAVGLGVKGPAGIPTAGVAGGTGEVLKQVRQELTKDPNRPNTFEERALKVGEAFVEEALSEAGGRGLGRVGEALMPKLDPALDKTIELFDNVAALGKDYKRRAFQYFSKWTPVRPGTKATLTLSQVLDPDRAGPTGWAQNIVNLMKGSLGGERLFAQADFRNKQVVDQLQDVVTDTFGNTSKSLTDPEFGALMMDTLNDGEMAHRIVGGFIYGQLDEVLAARGLSEAVDLSGMRASAQKLVGEFEKIKNIGREEVAGTLLEKIASLDTKLSFSEADFLRSNLLKIARNNPSLSETVGRFTGELTDELQTTARRLDIADAYNIARDFYRKGKGAFRPKAIEALLSGNKAPERAGQYIFRNGNAQEITQLRKALLTTGKVTRMLDKLPEDELRRFLLKNPNAKLPGALDGDAVWREVQSGYLKSAFDAATKDDLFSGKRFLERVSKGPGKATFEATIRDPAHRALLKEFARLSEVTQKADVGTGRRVMAIVQGGAVALLGGGNIAGVVGDREALAGSGMIFITPYIVSKLATSPLTVRLMVKAMKTSANEPGFGRLAVRLARAAAETNGLYPEDPEQQLREAATKAGQKVRAAVERGQNVLSLGQ